jgi:hypothetical protein
MKSLPERWRAAVNTVREASVRFASSLSYGKLVRLSPGEVALAFPREAGFHRATVTGSARAQIEKALSEHFGRPTRIVEESDAAAAGTPSFSLAEEEAKERADRERSIEANVREHPAVKTALRILGGQLEHVEVLEKGRASDADAEVSDEPT